MSEMPDLPTISDAELATFRRCRFVHRLFRARDGYRSISLPDNFTAFLDEWQTRGDEMLDDPSKFEVIKDGWDHEHCDVCWARVEEGDTYWPNQEGNVGQVDLCEKCYPRVMALLGAQPSDEPALPE